MSRTDSNIDVSSRAGRRRIRPGAVLWAVVAVAGSAWAFRHLDLREARRLTAGADAGWLLAACVPLLARFWVWGLKFSGMVRRQGAVPKRVASWGVVAAMFVNLVTPFAKLAGGIFRAAVLRKATGWRFSTAHGWIVADQISTFFGIASIYGLAALLSGLRTAGTGRLPLIASGVCVLAVTVMLVGLSTRVRAWFDRPRFSRFVDRLFAAPLWRRFQSRRARHDRVWYRAWLAPAFERSAVPSLQLRDIGMSAISWACLCASNAMVFRALGADVDPLAIAATLIAATFLGGFSVMGGVGVTEALLVVLWERLGVPPTVAASAAILHRAMLYAVIVGLGGASFVWLGARRPEHDTRADAAALRPDG